MNNDKSKPLLMEQTLDVKELNEWNEKGDDEGEGGGKKMKII